MNRSKCEEDQTTYDVRQTESGTPVGDDRRQLGINEATPYMWKKKFVHFGVSELRRLDAENARLKDLVADLTHDKDIQEVTIRNNQ
jgi:putative transposase